MASFYADPAVGGDGSTTTDDANATTGLDNYGYTERLVPMFTNALNIATYSKGRATAAAASAVEAAASASSALNAPGTNATSTTSVAIASGSKSFTIQTGKAYVVGQTLNVASAADPANFMAGQITSYNSGTGALVVNVTQTGGSGTKTDWVVSMGAIVSSTLPSMTSNSGKFLTNNGTIASWAAALIPGNNLSDVTTPATARTNLGLAIGTNVQAYDAGLASIAGLTTLADRMIYTTASDTYAVATLTSFARTLLDDVDQAAMRTTLALTPGTNVQAYNANLASLAGLTLAADKLPYATGAGAVALTDLSAFARTILDDADAGAVRTTITAAARGANTDITSLGGLTTALSIAQGGTGAVDAAAARTALGVYSPRGGATGTTSGGALTVDRVWGDITGVVRTGTGIFRVDMNAQADTYYTVIATAGGGYNRGIAEATAVEGSRSTTSFYMISHQGNASSTAGNMTDSPRWNVVLWA
jgi:hypothetical protein